MSDVIDDAQAYNELYQDVALTNQRTKSLPESHPDFNGINCIDCGDIIPAARIALKRIRCVACQEDIEKREKQFNRADSGRTMHFMTSGSAYLGFLGGPRKTRRGDY